MSSESVVLGKVLIMRSVIRVAPVVSPALNADRAARYSNQSPRSSLPHFASLARAINRSLAAAYLRRRIFVRAIILRTSQSVASSVSSNSMALLYFAFKKAVIASRVCDSADFTAGTAVFILQAFAMGTEKSFAGKVL